MSRSRLTLHPWKSIITLLIISVFFENIKVVSVMGTAFKPTHIVFILAIIVGIFERRAYKKDVIVGFLFAILPCLPLYRIKDLMEWFKSYVIYLLLLMFLVFAFRKFVYQFIKDAKYYIKLLLSIIAITQILGIVQFICMNFLNYFFLRDVFGRLEYQKNIFNMANSFYRAYSVYHEPSFFGLVTLASITILFVIGKNIFDKRKYYCYAILNIVAVFVSLSASCLIIFLILLVVHQFVKGGSKISKLLSILALTILLTVLALSTSILSPVMRLFTEVNFENSSGYERTTTQLMYIQKTLQYYPLLGRGIGQEGNVDAVGIIGLYSAINNALAGIVVNFGLCSLFFYVPLIRKAIYNCRNNVLWILIVLTIMGIYASTGAYISVDTFNMVVLLSAVGVTISKKTNKYKELYIGE